MVSCSIVQNFHVDWYDIFRTSLVYVRFVFCRCPDNAQAKQKMLYASSKEDLKKALGEGIAKEIQANDHGELQWESVLEICRGLDRD